MVDPRRGDVIWVNLDPTIGSEIRKKRPAVVVSNNAANQKYHQVTLVPCTSKKLDAIEPFQVYLESDESGLEKDSKALTEQIRTVSKLRLGHRSGHLGTETMTQIEKALKVHLDLD